MLEIVALTSVIVCIALTVWSAYTTQQGGGQTMKESVTEAWHNVVIGFTINYFANLVILPMVDSLGNSFIDPWENFLMGWIYTAISMIRSFCIRRYNNKKTEERKQAEINSGIMFVKKRT